MELLEKKLELEEEVKEELYYPDPIEEKVPWGVLETTYLVKHYENYKPQYIADLLGRTYAAVQGRHSVVLKLKEEYKNYKDSSDIPSIEEIKHERAMWYRDREEGQEIASGAKGVALAISHSQEALKKVESLKNNEIANLVTNQNTIVSKLKEAGIIEIKIH